MIKTRELTQVHSVKCPQHDCTVSSNSVHPWKPAAANYEEPIGHTHAHGG